MAWSKREGLVACFTAAGKPVTAQELLQLKWGPKEAGYGAASWAPWQASWYDELAEGAQAELEAQGEGSTSFERAPLELVTAASQWDSAAAALARPARRER